MTIAQAGRGGWAGRRYYADERESWEASAIHPELEQGPVPAHLRPPKSDDDEKKYVPKRHDKLPEVPAWMHRLSNARRMKKEMERVAAQKGASGGEGIQEGREVSEDRQGKGPGQGQAHPHGSLHREGQVLPREEEILKGGDATCLGISNSPLSSNDTTEGGDAYTETTSPIPISDSDAPAGEIDSLPSGRDCSQRSDGTEGIGLAGEPSSAKMADAPNGSSDCVSVPDRCEESRFAENSATHQLPATVHHGWKNDRGAGVQVRRDQMSRSGMGGNSPEDSGCVEIAEALTEPGSVEMIRSVEASAGERRNLCAPEGERTVHGWAARKCTGARETGEAAPAEGLSGSESWTLHQKPVEACQNGRGRGPSDKTPAEFRLYQSSSANLHMTRPAAERSGFSFGEGVVMLVDTTLRRVAFRRSKEGERGWRVANSGSAPGATSLSVGALLLRLGVPFGSYPLKYYVIDDKLLPGFEYPGEGP